MASKQPKLLDIVFNNLTTCKLVASQGLKVVRNNACLIHYLLTPVTYRETIESMSKIKSKYFLERHKLSDEMNIAESYYKAVCFEAHI